MSGDFHFRPGRTALLISMPHCGTDIPDTLAQDMTEFVIRDLPDTDWHMERLYDFAEAIGATILAARWSRYVIDLNRDPQGTPLYPGADNTELCPTTTFERAPVYRPDRAPKAEEIARRVGAFWRPYHDQLAATLAELKTRHGHALLFDAHSIRSRLPRFFEGRLPDLNLGTGGGASCDQQLALRLLSAATAEGDFSAVLNGRFKGGFITRRHGDPAGRVQAAQLELAQIAYMDETPPFAFDEAKAARLRPVLRRVVEAFAAFDGARAA